MKLCLWCAWIRNWIQKNEKTKPYVLIVNSSLHLEYKLFNQTVNNISNILQYFQINNFYLIYKTFNISQIYLVNMYSTLNCFPGNHARNRLFISARPQTGQHISKRCWLSFSFESIRTWIIAAMQHTHELIIPPLWLFNRHNTIITLLNLYIILNKLKLFPESKYPKVSVSNINNINAWRRASEHITFLYERQCARG